MNSSILAINKINIIDKFLSNTENILDYKIVLQLAMRIEVILLITTPKGKNWYFLQEAFKGLEKNILIREIEFEDDEDSKKQYDLIFTTKIDLGLRRRLSNLIQPIQTTIKKPCPVITFYSHKGGVGRTTALTFFASWLAQHHGKNVVVLDCDFEAPGFSSGNYFNFEKPTSGVVEYLLNKEYALLANETLNIEKDYSYRAGNEFEGKGKIYAIPAGNLSIEVAYDENGNELLDENGKVITYNHRRDYLEGLARIDITGTHHIIRQFEEFFADLALQLELTYENSVILIDSRTGFNDTFSVLATLSDIVVGIFGDNEQNKVGLYEFIDMFGKVGSSKDILIANTFSSSRGQEVYNNFCDIVKEYINQNKDIFEDDEMGKKPFIDNICKLEFHQALADWGTNRQEKDRLIRMIANPSALFDTEKFITKLFELLDSRVGQHQDSQEEKKKSQLDELTLQLPIIDSENLEFFLENSKNKVNPITTRESLLKNLQANLPFNYALETPKLGDFFFRDCMKDLFKRDKFLIVGYKGTGKTLLYLAFQNLEITNKLCEYYQEKYDKYIFINVIPVYSQSERNQYFDVDANFTQEMVNKVGKEYFYKSFWLIYTWNAIFSNPQIKKMAITQPIEELFEVNIKNARKISDLVRNNDKIFSIQENLITLDEEISKKGKVILLSYDQLDFITAPHHWLDKVSPLINYWRINPFSAIYPKIFLRADIYENQGIGNITNIKELDNYAINLAWSREELFSYWFKFVFKTDKKKFLQLCYYHGQYLSRIGQQLLEIDKILEKDNQIPIDKEKEIKYLVDNFFGKYANRYNTGENFGTSYEWFYNNLADGKGMISIRPFRDLMLKSMEIALQEEYLKREARQDYNSKQVLSAFYYSNRDATKFYSEAYYNDLAGGDNKNSSLYVFYEYVTRVAKSYEKVYEFSDHNFHNLLSQLINKNKHDSRLTVKNVDEFRVLLVSNGIFKIEKRNGKQKFIMPFLYRNYFEVGSPMRNSKI